MKKRLIREYWLILVAWCAYLNSWNIIAYVIMMAATGYALMIRCEADHWRIAAVCISCYSVMMAVLFASNVPYFYPDLHIFLAFVAFNSALTNEYLIRLKKQFIFPLLLMGLIGISILTLSIMLVPGEDYTLITKGSLLRMSAFIFLPFLTPLLLQYGYKSLPARKKKVIKKQSFFIDI
ncbi:MAG: hypothetical protein IKI61_10015 [Erysipelotrichaceae bacterium]|jgi:hypothetical protein|nr:hypothetical protein [Erysipelotrichaceae bacterium]